MPIPYRYPAFLWQQLALHFPEDLSGARCLDLGCANGYMTLELAKRGAHVVAVDRTERFLKSLDFVARKRGLRHLIELRLLDFHDSDWETSLAGPSWDIAICAGVLYHLDRPEEFVSAVSRLPIRRLLGETRILLNGKKPVKTYPDSRPGTLLPKEQLQSSFEQQPATSQFAFYPYVPEENEHWLGPPYAAKKNRVLFRVEFNANAH